MKRVDEDEKAWQQAKKFTRTDLGWVIMSVGMAIGAGIVFLPVQVGLLGLWVFLLSSLVGYPALYLFQRLFINTLASAKECQDYPQVISSYLGKNWGAFLGFLYFVMLTIWMFVYSIAITNDSASFLQSFGLTKSLWSENPFYGLGLICLLVALASRGEQLLFKVATPMVLIKLGVVAILGVMMVGRWDIGHIGSIPKPTQLVTDSIIMLPFTLTSILFLQSLSPMVISYRQHEKSAVVARFKAVRTMRIAFTILFIVVFFYAISFTLAMSHEQSVSAYKQNISALAMVAQGMSGDTLRLLSLLLNIFAVMTAYFGVYLGFTEACRGLVLNGLRRFMPQEKISQRWVERSVMLFAILLSWGAIVLNAPVLSFTSICSPIFGIVGCLLPAYLVYRVPSLHKYKGISLYLIMITGVLLCLSPFLAFLYEF